ncbi:MAG TPA: SH3 domain-containing protein, partial [Oceanipulchritudo sp.]|nr:SH3 domain-containing protein [Oceanipulchritudo sp.]
GKNGILLRDYDATELNLEVGDRLEVTLVLNGWYFARNSKGQIGWVPERVVRIVSQGAEGEAPEGAGQDA